MNPLPDFPTNTRLREQPVTKILLYPSLRECKSDRTEKFWILVLSILLCAM
jgi:hypothetical protein